jgi:hypothetical protein
MKLLQLSLGHMSSWASQGQGATSSQPVEAQQGRRVTSSQPVEAQQGRRVTSSQPVEAQQGRRVTSSQPEEAQMVEAVTSSAGAVSQQRQLVNQRKYNEHPAVRVMRRLADQCDFKLVAVSAVSSTGTFKEPAGYDKQQPLEFEGRRFTVPYTFTAVRFTDLVTPPTPVPVQVLFPVCSLQS